MKKLKLGKKTVAILIIVAVIVALGGACGATYAIVHRQLRAPEFTDVSVIAEPSYTIDIEWEKVSGAKSYTLEYKYALYPNETHTVTDITATSYSIRMVKGLLEYRIKSVGKYSSNDSAFSEWKSYEVEPLTLDTFRGFDLKLVEGRGYQIDMDYFYPVEYVYKGETYKINYYEIDFVNEDEFRDDLNPYAYSLTELQEGINYYLPVGSGEWTVYVRPVLYVNVNGVKDYTSIEGLYELYDENIEFTVKNQIV